jgi:hypothetical protein
MKEAAAVAAAAAAASRRRRRHRRTARYLLLVSTSVAVHNGLFTTQPGATNRIESANTNATAAYEHTYVHAGGRRAPTTLDDVSISITSAAVGVTIPYTANCDVTAIRTLTKADEVVGLRFIDMPLWSTDRCSRPLELRPGSGHRTALAIASLFVSDKCRHCPVHSNGRRE